MTASFAIFINSYYFAYQWEKWSYALSTSCAFATQFNSKYLQHAIHMNILRVRFLSNMLTEQMWIWSMRNLNICWLSRTQYSILSTDPLCAHAINANWQFRIESPTAHDRDRPKDAKKKVTTTAHFNYMQVPFSFRKLNRKYCMYEMII